MSLETRASEPNTRNREAAACSIKRLVYISARASAGGPAGPMGAQRPLSTGRHPADGGRPTRRGSGGSGPQSPAGDGRLSSTAAGS